MSCPLNRNRWAGSGFVKQPETGGSKDLDARIAAMMAERDAQDAKSFPGSVGIAQCVPTGPGGGNGTMPPTRPAGCSAITSGTCPPPKKTTGGK
jgi:hypothetical protein